MAAASETMKQTELRDVVPTITEADKAKALSEMAGVISSKAEDEAAKTQQMDRFVTLYCKYQHYELNFDQTIGKETLVGLAFKADNIEICIKLFIWGATLPNNIMEAIVEKRPAFLEEMRVEKENRKKLSGDFNNAFEALINQATTDLAKKNEERDQRNFKILADFQVKCQSVLQQVEPLHKRMEVIITAWNQQIPGETIKARDLKKEISKILATINQHSLVVTRALLQIMSDMIPKDRESLSIRGLMVFYFYIAEKFNGKKKEIDGMIEKSLPIQIRAEVKQLVADDRVIFNKVLNDLMLALLAGNKDMLVAFRSKIPVDFYEGIWNKQNDFTHQKLIPINRDYLFEIKRLIDSFREKLSSKYEILFGLIPNRAIVQGVIQARSMQFDGITTGLLKTLIVFPENSFDRFSQISDMRRIIEFCAENLQLRPDCMVAVLRSNQYNKPEDRQALVVAYNNKQNQVEPSQADVKRQDERTLKALEQARRAAAKDKDNAQQGELLLLQKAQEKIQKDKIVKDQVKTKLLQRSQQLKDAEETLLIKIFSPGDLHRLIEEADFIKLVRALGLDPRPNAKGTGGYTFNIQTIPEPINFHHWEGDKAGTLDGNVLRKFREALTAVGISREDLAKSKLPQPATTASPVVK